MRHDVPILEFDPEREALIDPQKLIQPLPAAPEACVLCFFRDVLQDLHGRGQARILVELRSEQGTNPLYEVQAPDRRAFMAVHPGVGAPLAAGHLEELIALGGRRFVACGGAGVLHGHLPVGHILIPDSAVRDEGTSYHYLPPAREVQLDPASVATLQQVLAQQGVAHTVGKTWTTDAFYRETPQRIARRRAEGCLMVEMECAAFAAVAEFRRVAFAQLLYGGDDVSAEVWDSRGWTEKGSIRQQLFWLAAAGALAL